MLIRLFFIILGPVCYTHLDVYKRQLPKGGILPYISRKYHILRFLPLPLPGRPLCEAGTVFPAPWPRREPGQRPLSCRTTKPSLFSNTRLKAIRGTHASLHAFTIGSVCLASTAWQIMAWLLSPFPAAGALALPPLCPRPQSCRFPSAHCRFPSRRIPPSLSLPAKHTPFFPKK